MEKVTIVQFFLLVAILNVSCTKDEVNPEDKPEIIDSSCELNIVYRDSKNSSATTTIYIKNGYGSDTVEYRDFGDDNLVYYTTFKYNSDNQVSLSQMFDPNDVMETETTIEYWPNGKRKKVVTERKKLETLYDKSNAVQETYFDEKGNITEYMNFSNSGSLMNHLIYINTYENEVLVQAFRDDQKYTYDAILEYTYYSDVSSHEVISKDVDEKVTGKTVYEYSDNNEEMKRYSSDDALLGSEKTYLNDNGVILKTESLDATGTVVLEHVYEYNCPE